MHKRATAHLNSAKGIPGPGRPKLTPEKKAEKLALMDHYKAYLESGEAVKDFERVRKKNPLAALTKAEGRILGTPKQSVDVTATTESYADRIKRFRLEHPR